MDGVAYYSLWLGIYLATGFQVKLRRVTIRLGFASDSATEIIISGLEVSNPTGGYLSENIISLDRLEVHVKVRGWVGTWLCTWVGRYVVMYVGG